MTRTRGAGVLRGVVLGALAFIVGSLMTWILAGTNAARLTVGGPFGSGVPDWRAVLWLFYDSQFVGTRTPGVYGPDGDLLAGSGLVDTVGLLGVEYLFAVPVVVLLLAGALSAWLTGVTSTREASMAGARVAFGYLLLVVVGLFVGTQTGVGPSPIRALVVAGVVYPIVFGALGGVLTSVLGRDSTDSVPGSTVR